MEASVVGKVHHALHKLGPAPVVFRPIVEMDHQGGEVRKALAYRVPPPGDTVGQTVAGDVGADPIEKDCIAGGHQDTHGSQGRLGREIVIGRLDLESTFAPTRKRAACDGGFGIEGKAQGIGGGIGIMIDLM
jgi:hypothetical protein